MLIDIPTTYIVWLNQSQLIAPTQYQTWLRLITHRHLLFVGDNSSYTPKQQTEFDRLLTVWKNLRLWMPHIDDSNVTPAQRQVWKLFPERRSNWQVWKNCEDRPYMLASDQAAVYEGYYQQMLSLLPSYQSLNLNINTQVIPIWSLQPVAFCVRPSNLTLQSVSPVNKGHCTYV